jgi:hypothetical protein
MRGWLSSYPPESSVSAKRLFNGANSGAEFGKSYNGAWHGHIESNNQTECILSKPSLQFTVAVRPVGGLRLDCVPAANSNAPIEGGFGRIRPS